MTAQLQAGDLEHLLAQPNEPERELSRLWRTNAPLVIFDVGSCEGEDSIRYARRFPHARLFAFEPLPENQTLIRENFARYGIHSAELVQSALSDHVGEASLHVSSGKPSLEFAGKNWNYGNKSSSLLEPASSEPMHGWIRFKEPITVPTDTIDHFCAQRGIHRIDFIHMDVQGAEHLVLAGAVHMLPNVDALWLEVSDQALYRGQKLRSDMQRLLEAQGFRLSFETRREIEGDQFYVNTRRPSARLYFVGRQIRHTASQLRRLADRLIYTLRH